MASKRTPHELAEEILALVQNLVLELGGGDSGPPGGKESPAQLDLRTAVEEEPDSSSRLVGASWAPRSWS